jgi:predicted PurR-regulated permease PerM
MPVDAPTPIVITRRTRNIGAFVLILVLAFICWQAPAVPKLALAGASLAVLLSFPVRLLSRWVPRGVATALVLLTMLSVSVVAIVIIVPLVFSQLTALASDVPSLAEDADARLREIAAFLAARGLIGSSPEQAIADLQNEVLVHAQAIGQQALGRILGAFTSVFGVLLSLFGIFFVSLYLLSDAGRFKRTFVRALPRVYRDDAETLWDESGDALSRYLSGLLISLTFQGVSSSVVLYLLDVPYSLLFGIWTAIAAIVPYVGSYIGGVPAVIAGLFVSPLTAVLVGLTYFTINQIDGNLIAPRVQGKAIGVHPLVVFLGVIAGGQIAGLFGALLAVPLLAILRVLIEFLDLRLRVEDDSAHAAAISALPATSDGITPAGNGLPERLGSQEIGAKSVGQ